MSRSQANSRAHYLHTAVEILEQTHGKVDAFCDFVGTGGTFAGCAARLKEHNPEIKCYVVEPESAAAMAGLPITASKHRIQGGGYSMRHLDLIEPRQIDGFVQVSEQRAIAITRRLATEEGLFTGFSSGANIAAAIQLLSTVHEGQTVVTLLNDSGLKYLSGDLW